MAKSRMGYWLYRDPEAPRLTGLAVVGEMHYVTSVQDADFVGGISPVPGFPGSTATALIGNPDNRFDVVNATIGIQALLFEASSLRVAGAYARGMMLWDKFFKK